MKQWKARPWHRVYWKREWAEIKAAKWYFPALAILFYLWNDSVINAGFIRFQEPGQTWIYYFGLPPAIFGFLFGVFLTLLLKKTRETGLKYEDLHWHDFHKGIIVGPPHPDTEQRYPFRKEGEN